MPEKKPPLPPRSPAEAQAAVMIQLAAAVAARAARAAGAPEEGVGQEEEKKKKKKEEEEGGTGAAALLTACDGVSGRSCSNTGPGGAHRCEGCGGPHHGLYGAGRFCGTGCRSRFNARKHRTAGGRRGRACRAR